MKYLIYEDNIEFVLIEDIVKVYEMHNHVNNYVIGLVLNGEIEIIKNGRTNNCQEDDFFLIPTYEPHELRINNKNTKVLSLCIDKEFLKSHNIDDAKYIIMGYVQKLIETDVLSSRKAESYFDMIDLLYSVYVVNKKDFPLDIKAISKKLQEEPEKEWSLEEISKEIFVSKYYLVRKFKKNIGLTPHNFQVQNKIRNAQKLLMSGKSVADTAADMGFYDQSHFIRSFEKYIGISPIEYINSINK